jgi:DNA invertase Pin-like site-specific DNA recombinase
MPMPTSSHIFFIPGVLLIGMFLGFILGARAARNQFDLQRKREEEREAVRAARAAKKAAGTSDAKDT